MSVLGAHHICKAVRGVARLTHTITGHEQTQLNLSLIFFSLVYCLLPEDLTEPRSEKTGLRGFRQVRHKPGCAVTENA